MFEQVPFNWFQAIAQDTLAQFDCAVSRILLNVPIEITLQQIEHDCAFDCAYHNYLAS